MAASYADLKLFIGGEWVSGGGRRTQPVVNPATEEVLGELPHASKADLDRALALAEKGFALWRAVPPPERGKILRRAADLMRERTDDIARIATMEEGKTLSETRWKLRCRPTSSTGTRKRAVVPTAACCRSARRELRLTVVKEPVGPVAGFAPWNFPLGNPARKLGAALGAGCTCILKPAEETPASALAIAQALVDAGLPAGVLSVVFGVPAEVSTHLIASPVIRAISFTGSIPVGKQLMKLAADGMKRTTMELGGHAPVLVFDDVDVEQVLDLAVGVEIPQRRPGVRIAHALLRARIDLRQVCRRVRGARQGAARSTWHGARRADGAAGARPARAGVGGADRGRGDERRKAAARWRTARAQGLFLRADGAADVPHTARIMNEEPFGPVAILNPFRDFDEVIKQANRLPYGLAAYAFTRSSRPVNLLGEQIEAGMIGINSYQISVPEAPFGGVKESGHGSEEGIEGLDACLVTKFISES